MIPAAIWLWAMVRWFDVTGPVTITALVLIVAGWLWGAGRDMHDRLWTVWGY